MANERALRLLLHLKEDDVTVILLQINYHHVGIQFFGWSCLPVASATYPTSIQGRHPVGETLDMDLKNLHNALTMTTNEQACDFEGLGAQCEEAWTEQDQISGATILTTHSWVVISSKLSYNYPAEVMLAFLAVFHALKYGVGCKTKHCPERGFNKVHLYSKRACGGMEA